MVYLPRDSQGPAGPRSHVSVIRTGFHQLITGPDFIGTTMLNLENEEINGIAETRVISGVSIAYIPVEISTGQLDSTLSRLNTALPSASCANSYSAR
jgi:hypothetical protein